MKALLLFSLIFISQNVSATPNIKCSRSLREVDRAAFDEYNSHFPVVIPTTANSPYLTEGLQRILKNPQVKNLKVYAVIDVRGLSTVGFTEYFKDNFNLYVTLDKALYPDGWVGIQIYTSRSDFDEFLGTDVSVRRLIWAGLRRLR